MTVFLGSDSEEADGRFSPSRSQNEGERQPQGMEAWWGHGGGPRGAEGLRGTPLVSAQLRCGGPRGGVRALPEGPQERAAMGPQTGDG